MTLKPNMYVRTKDGYIAKYDNSKHNCSGEYYGFDSAIKDIRCIIEDDDEFLWESELDNISKASFNIIDLIEVGDFITYKKGNMYIGIPYRVYGTYNEILEETELRIDDEYLKDIEILSIVTKEMFESMEYEVE